MSSPKRPTSSRGADADSSPESYNPPVRLQKFLAAAGVASRRDCEELIAAGRVTVDGREVRDLGSKVIPGSQKVAVDGEVVRAKARRYYIINKPKGYVCSHYDRERKPLAVSLVPDAARLFTVGRLDEASSGLLLVTNDGDVAERLAHPRYQVERRYQVQVAGVPTLDTLQLLARGIPFAEGRFRVRGVRSLKTQGKSSFLEVVLTEGQNREIRRLFARVGHKVLSLTRVGFGPLKLAGLPIGAYRPLTPPEIRDLLALLTESKTRVTQQRGNALMSGRLKIRPARGAGGERPAEESAESTGSRGRDAERGGEARGTGGRNAGSPQKNPRRGSGGNAGREERSGGPRGIGGRDSSRGGGERPQRPARPDSGEFSERRSSRPGADDRPRSDERPRASERSEQSPRRDDRRAGGGKPLSAAARRFADGTQPPRERQSGGESERSRGPRQRSGREGERFGEGRGEEREPGRGRKRDHTESRGEDQSFRTRRGPGEANSYESSRNPSAPTPPKRRTIGGEAPPPVETPQASGSGQTSFHGRRGRTVGGGKKLGELFRGEGLRPSSDEDGGDLPLPPTPQRGEQRRPTGDRNFDGDRRGGRSEGSQRSDAGQRGGAEGERRSRSAGGGGRSGGQGRGGQAGGKSRRTEEGRGGGGGGGGGGKSRRQSGGGGAKNPKRPRTDRGGQGGQKRRG